MYVYSAGSAPVTELLTLFQARGILLQIEARHWKLFLLLPGQGVSEVYAQPRAHFIRRNTFPKFPFYAIRLCLCALVANSPLQSSELVRTFLGARFGVFLCSCFCVKTVR